MADYDYEPLGLHEPLLPAKALGQSFLQLNSLFPLGLSPLSEGEHLNPNHSAPEETLSTQTGLGSSAPSQTISVEPRIQRTVSDHSSSAKDISPTIQHLNQPPHQDEQPLNSSYTVTNQSSPNSNIILPKRQDSAELSKESNNNSHEANISNSNDNLSQTESIQREVHQNTNSDQSSSEIVDLKQSASPASRLFKSGWEVIQGWLEPNSKELDPSNSTSNPFKPSTTDESTPAKVPTSQQFNEAIQRAQDPISESDANDSAASIINEDTCHADLECDRPHALNNKNTEIEVNHIATNSPDVESTSIPIQPKTEEQVQQHVSNGEQLIAPLAPKTSEGESEPLQSLSSDSTSGIQITHDSQLKKETTKSSFSSDQQASSRPLQPDIIQAKTDQEFPSSTSNLGVSSRKSYPDQSESNVSNSEQLITPTVSKTSEGESEFLQSLPSNSTSAIQTTHDSQLKKETTKNSLSSDQQASSRPLQPDIIQAKTDQALPSSTSNLEVSSRKSYPEQSELNDSALRIQDSANSGRDTDHSGSSDPIQRVDISEQTSDQAAQLKSEHIGSNKPPRKEGSNPIISSQTSQTSASEPLHQAGTENIQLQSSKSASREETSTSISEIFESADSTAEYSEPQVEIDSIQLQNIESPPSIRSALEEIDSASPSYLDVETFVNLDDFPIQKTKDYSTTQSIQNSPTDNQDTSTPQEPNPPKISSEQTHQVQQSSKAELSKAAFAQKPKAHDSSSSDVGRLKSHGTAAQRDEIKESPNETSTSELGSNSQSSDRSPEPLNIIQSKTDNKTDKVALTQSSLANPTHPHNPSKASSQNSDSSSEITTLNETPKSIPANNEAALSQQESNDSDSILDITMSDDIPKPSIQRQSKHLTEPVTGHSQSSEAQISQRIEEVSESTSYDSQSSDKLESSSYSNLEATHDHEFLPLDSKGSIDSEGDSLSQSKISLTTETQKHSIQRRPEKHSTQVSQNEDSNDLTPNRILSSQEPSEVTPKPIIRENTSQRYTDETDCTAPFIQRQAGHSFETQADQDQSSKAKLIPEREETPGSTTDPIQSVNQLEPSSHSSSSSKENDSSSPLKAASATNITIEGSTFQAKSLQSQEPEGPKFQSKSPQSQQAEENSPQQMTENISSQLYPMDVPKDIDPARLNLSNESLEVSTHSKDPTHSNQGHPVQRDPSTGKTILQRSVAPKAEPSTSSSRYDSTTSIETSIDSNRCIADTPLTYSDPLVSDANETSRLDLNEKTSSPAIPQAPSQHESRPSSQPSTSFDPHHKSQNSVKSVHETIQKQPRNSSDAKSIQSSSAKIHDCSIVHEDEKRPHLTDSQIVQYSKEEQFSDTISPTSEDKFDQSQIKLNNSSSRSEYDPLNPAQTTTSHSKEKGEQSSYEQVNPPQNSFSENVPPMHQRQKDSSLETLAGNTENLDNITSVETTNRISAPESQLSIQSLSSQVRYPTNETQTNADNKEHRQNRQPDIEDERHIQRKQILNADQQEVDFEANQKDTNGSIFPPIQNAQESDLSIESRTESINERVRDDQSHSSQSFSQDFARSTQHKDRLIDIEKTLTPNISSIQSSSNAAPTQSNPHLPSHHIHDDGKHPYLNDSKIVQYSKEEQFSDTIPPTSEDNFAQSQIEMSNSSSRSEYDPLNQAQTSTSHSKEKWEQSSYEQVNPPQNSFSENVPPVHQCQNDSSLETLAGSTENLGDITSVETTNRISVPESQLSIQSLSSQVSYATNEIQTNVSDKELRQNRLPDIEDEQHIQRKQKQNADQQETEFNSTSSIQHKHRLVDVEKTQTPKISSIQSSSNADPTQSTPHPLSHHVQSIAEKHTDSGIYLDPTEISEDTSIQRKADQPRQRLHPIKDEPPESSSFVQGKSDILNTIKQSIDIESPKHAVSKLSEQDFTPLDHNSPNSDALVIKTGDLSTDSSSANGKQATTVSSNSLDGEIQCQVNQSLILPTDQAQAIDSSSPEKIVISTDTPELNIFSPNPFPQKNVTPQGENIRTNAKYERPKGDQGSSSQTSAKYIDRAKEKNDLAESIAPPPVQKQVDNIETKYPSVKNILKPNVSSQHQQQIESSSSSPKYNEPSLVQQSISETDSRSHATSSYSSPVLNHSSSIESSLPTSSQGRSPKAINTEFDTALEKEDLALDGAEVRDVREGSTLQRAEQDSTKRDNDEQVTELSFNDQSLDKQTQSEQLQTKQHDSIRLNNSVHLSEHDNALSIRSLSNPNPINITSSKTEPILSDTNPEHSVPIPTIIQSKIEDLSLDHPVEPEDFSNPGSRTLPTPTSKLPPGENASSISIALLGPMDYSSHLETPLGQRKPLGGNHDLSMRPRSNVNESHSDPVITEQISVPKSTPTTAHNPVSQYAKRTNLEKSPEQWDNLEALISSLETSPSSPVSEPLLNSSTLQRSRNLAYSDTRLKHSDSNPDLLESSPTAHSISNPQASMSSDDQVILTPTGFHRGQDTSKFESTRPSTLQMKTQEKTHISRKASLDNVETNRSSPPMTLTSANSDLQEQSIDSKEFEQNFGVLASAIYRQLRQRLAVERERHGRSSTGRLPW